MQGANQSSFMKIAPLAVSGSGGSILVHWLQALVTKQTLKSKSIEYVPCWLLTHIVKL